MGDMMMKMAMSEMGQKAAAGMTGGKGTDMLDMIDGGGFGKTGDQFAGGGMSTMLNDLGIKPYQRADRPAAAPQPRMSSQSRRPPPQEPPMEPMRQPPPVSATPLPPQNPYTVTQDGSIPARSTGGLPMLDDSGTITRRPAMPQQPMTEEEMKRMAQAALR